MQYLIAFYDTAEDFATRGRGDEAFWRGWREYFQALDGAGIRVGGLPLEDPSRAATARVRSGETTVHDGPYADTKEQLGGFAIIDVPTLDDALAWAQRVPSAKSRAVEVRPVLPRMSGNDDPEPAPLRSAMKYVLGIYETAEGFASRQGEASERYWAGWAAYSKALHDAGVIVDGAALQPPSTATLVRVNGDARTIQDGPYADTKEQLGGFIVLDVPTLEDALAWAARAPAASSGAVEVRPVLQLGVPA